MTVFPRYNALGPLWTREHRLFSFLTTEANDVVRPIHAKAMPVMLTRPEEWDIWLDGSLDEAIALQRPLPNEKLRIVGTGQKADERGGRFQRKAHP
ncbi:MAG: SOS response-associated peptidase family protein [Methylocella sp.]